MKTKQLLVGSLAVVLFGVSGASLAAAPVGNDASAIQNKSSGTEGAAREDGSPRMGHMMRRGMQDGGGMMGNGMMGNGMMGMMGSCPMMDGMSGANGKVMMQMHGEMMRAMGDIMIKYADKFEAPPSK